MSAPYQPGDTVIIIEGEAYRLRLTLGALAELSSYLEARGPRALAQILRGADQAQMFMAICALLRPVHGEIVFTRPVPRRVALPAIAEVLERAFSGGEDE